MIFLIVCIILVLCAIACAIGWIIGAGASRNALDMAAFEREEARAQRDRALDTAANLIDYIDYLSEQADMLHDYALEMDDQLLHASARLADVEEAIASMREYQVKQPRRKHTKSATGSEAKA